MNVDVYLFGNLGNGYTQYVDDSSRTLFKSIAKRSKANSQLFIHREETMMYYAYVRRLRSKESSDDRYLGICYALNNRLIRDIAGLFKIFEEAITTITVRGVLLEYTNEGEIISTVGKIYNAKAEFAHLSAYLKNEIDAFMAGKDDTLPPPDYSVNTGEVKVFCHTDPQTEILKALAIYSNIFIIKDTNYIDEESKSYVNILCRLNKENETLRSKNEQLRKEQKRTKVVAWLIVILLVAATALVYFLNRASEQGKQIDVLTQYVATLKKDSTKLADNYNELTHTLNVANNKLVKANGYIINLKQDSSMLKQQVDSCQSVISSIENNVEKERGQTKKVTDDFNAFKKNLANNPIIIYDVQLANTDSNGVVETDYGGYIFSFYSMYITPKIKYIGVTSGKQTLKVKLYYPNGTLSRGDSSPTDCSYTSDQYISTGKNELTLSGWGGDKRGHWSKGNYKIEIWCGNTCLYTKVFKIY